MGAIEDMQQNIQHDKNVIDGMRQEKQKLEKEWDHFQPYIKQTVGTAGEVIEIIQSRHRIPVYLVKFNLRDIYTYPAYLLKVIP